MILDTKKDLQISLSQHDENFTLKKSLPFYFSFHIHKLFIRIY